MSTLTDPGPGAPAPAPQPTGRPWTAAGWVLGALVVTAVATAAAWQAVEWRMGRQLEQATAEVAALRAELAQRDQQMDQREQELSRQLQATQEQLMQRVAEVEQAAREAALIVQGSEGSANLAQRLAEIGALKDALARQQEATNQRLAELQQSIEEQIGQQGRETAAALATDMKLRSLLTRTQGHVLKTRVDLAEGNRGLAREELALAARSLQQAVDAAPDERKAGLQALQGLLEQSRTDLVLDSPTARDHLDLLWHQLNDALTEG